MFILQDKVTKENCGIRIIPASKDEYQKSSTINIDQSEDKEIQSQKSILTENETKSMNNIYSSDTLKEKNQSKNNFDKNEDIFNNIFNYVEGHEFEGIFNHFNNINKSLANF